MKDHRTTLADQYEKTYELCSEFPEQTDDSEVAFFASLVKKEKSRILDIGSAEGKLAIELARRGHYVTAVDISQGFLDQTIDRAKKCNVRISAMKADVESDLPQVDGGYDFIFFCDVIEHLRNPVRALSNIRKALAEDGTLLLQTPNSYSFGRLLWYMIKKSMHENYTADNVMTLHLSTYDFRTLEQVLAYVGLKTVKVLPTPLTVWGSFAIPAEKVPKRLIRMSDNLRLLIESVEPIDIEELMAKWSQKKTHK
jgi:2-polyprenyl-3-methyl-5-hydroxy-6-metoxy-1,4-benzoquinol methylase